MISFYFCWGERGKQQVESMLEKCQVAGVWSWPWGMSRSFLGWGVGKSHCRPRKRHGQQHRGVDLSSAIGDGLSECDVPGTMSWVQWRMLPQKQELESQAQNVSRPAPTPTPGEQHRLRPLAWISRSTFKLHLWLWIAFVTLVWFEGF